MRLPHQDQIKQIILSFDPDAEIYLFGSRVDDSKKGGDIDLLILSSVLDFKAKQRILIKLYDLLGEQKIDILIRKDIDDPFTAHAHETGIKL